jgi:capsular exopolysaccharide synthesis family protein
VSNPAPLPSPETEPLVSLAKIWRTTLTHWGLAVAIALTVAIGVTLYTLSQTEVFLSQATIQIDPRPARPLGTDVQSIVDMGQGAYWNNKEYYETQFSIIRSRRTAELTVRELGLHKDHAFLRNLPEGAPSIPAAVTVEGAANALRSRITVSPVKDSRLAIVGLKDANPKRAQRILTVLLDNYIQQNLDDMQFSTSTASEWLRGQLGKLKTELEQREMDLNNYQKDKDILSMSLEDQVGMLRHEMERLNLALTDARGKKEAVNSRRVELEKVVGSDPAVLPAHELLNNALLQGFRRDYVDAVRERGSLMASGLGERHPQVDKASARVEVTRAALLKEVTNVKGAVGREDAALKREIAGLQRLFDRAKKASLGLNLMQIEYNRLRRTKDNTEKLYSLVLERTKESDLERAMGFNNIRVIDSPLAPKAPVSPNVPVNVAFGIIAGLALGIAGAFGRAQLDRSLKTPDEIESRLGVHFLGLVPDVDRGSGSAYGAYGSRRSRAKPDVVPEDVPREFIAHAAPKSGVAEAARAIRTNIMFMAPDQPFKSLLVTSAGPSEGKTTVACYISTAMAQTGLRVLLVDCDMRRPRVHKVFGKSNDRGVTTLLFDQGEIEDLDLSTEIPNLDVIPTGPLPPNPAELLQSERFAQFRRLVLSRYDRVVFDSPPIAPVTDAVVLATQVDGTVLVVRAFKTRRDVATRCVRALRDVGATIVGAVMNAVNLGANSYGYHQYYYYRQEYGTKEPAPGEGPSAEA